MKKRLLSCLLAACLALGLCVPCAGAAAAPKLTAQGWMETLCAELDGVSDADVTAVSYSGAMSGSLQGDDLVYLVRDMEGGVRIDIPGLKAGKYALSVTAAGKTYTASDIQVQAHDRSGFAHKVYGGDGKIGNYTQGVGAYKDDGTLKENAVVLYVTNDNKNTVVLTGTDTNTGSAITVTGIGTILRSNNNGSKNKGILNHMAKQGKPLVVRFLGTVKAPNDVTAWEEGSSNGGMVEILRAANVTLEGIGPDAAIDGWGFSFCSDKDDDVSVVDKNFEVRNLAFRNVPEDCVEIAGRTGAPVEHVWVHNCSFYVPHIDNPAESDKAEGDGACDFKLSNYMTMSYNYFEGYHKTNMVGASKDQKQYHITWHHNWWKNCESRSPLARQADMHLYNNLYEDQSSYCMSLRANCYIFSEYNTFLNCKKPVVDEANTNTGKEEGGGVCKSYKDVFTGCTGTNDAKKVEDKTAAVESTNPYAGFESDAERSYIPGGDYLLDTDAAAAQAKVRANAGPMKTMDKTATPGTSDPEPPASEPPASETPDPEVVEHTVTMKLTGLTSNAPAKVADKADLDVTLTVVDPEDKRLPETVRVTVSGGALTAGTGYNYYSGLGKLTVYTVSGDVVVTAAAADKPECPHANTEVRDAKEPTCTERGYTGDTYCKDCGVKLTAGKNIARLNHNYESGACTVCGAKKPTSSTGSTTRPSGGGSGSTAPAKPTEPAEPTPAESLPYQDVAETDWYYQSVKTICDLGLMNGVDDTHFDPKANTNRAMVATVLFRLDGEEKVDVQAAFNDVDDGSWYEDAVTWASEKGIVKGYNATTFAPEDNVTREQLAVMLYRYAAPKEAVKTTLDSFTDGEAVSDWAVEAMAWAVDKGIIQGKGAGKLDPQGLASRAEICAMLVRFVDLDK